MTSIVKKAKATAEFHHRNQVRRFSGEPYINHPAKVVEILIRFGCRNRHTLAAAWLHDTVEDTDLRISDIYERFNPTVAEMVWGMTKPVSAKSGERRRIEINNMHLWAYPDCHVIKLADILANIGSIESCNFAIEHDPNYLKYVKQKYEQFYSIHGPSMSKPDRMVYVRLRQHVMRVLEGILKHYGIEVE